MANKKGGSLERKKGNQVIPRKIAFQKASAYFPQALNNIVDLMDSKHPAVKFGACKLIYETMLPQKFVQEFQTENGESLIIPLLKLHEIRRNNSDSEDSQPTETD